MEKGFYHPDRGYWQTTNVPNKEASDAYPKGTVEVTIKPSGDHQWQNGEWVKAIPDPAIALAQARAAAIEEIIADTERKRLDAVRDAVEVKFRGAKSEKDVADKLVELKTETGAKGR